MSLREPTIISPGDIADAQSFLIESDKFRKSLLSRRLDGNIDDFNDAIHADEVEAEGIANG